MPDDFDDDNDAAVPDELLIGDCLPPRELFPKGQYAAICYAVADIGTQEVTEYKSTATRLSRKLIICWEFPKLRIDIEDEYGNTCNLPRSRRQFFSFSLHEKSNLRKTLESWRGEGFTTEELKNFNIFNLVGAPAFIQIIHEKKEDGTVIDKMNSIMPLPEEMEEVLGPMENHPLKYGYNREKRRWPKFPENMPEYMRNAIYSSEEWQKQNAAKKAAQTASVEGAPEKKPPAKKKF